MTYVNRTTLIQEIARRTRTGDAPLRKRDVELVLDLFLELLVDELSKPDGRVGLTGLGILEVKPFRVRGRLKYVPHDPEKISYRIHFRAFKALKESLREETQMEAQHE